MSAITLQFDTAADLESALLDALQNNEGHVSGIAAYLAQTGAEAVAPEAKPDAWQSRWYNSDPAHARVGWSEWTQLSQQAGESLQDAARRWRGRICDTFEIRPLFAAPSAPPAPPANPWKEAVIDELAEACMDAPLTESPSSILKRVIAWHIQVATDPAVNGGLSLQPVAAPPAPLPGKENLALLQQAYDALDSMGGFGFTQKASKAMHELRAALSSPPTLEAAPAIATRILQAVRTAESDAALRIVIEREIAALSAQAAPADYQPPDILFDSYAVYQALSDKAKARTSAENVADVLDAIVRAQRSGVSADPLPDLWKPSFDVMSPKQEQLVQEFCAEIAGPRGQPGRPPDPVRLLEMAQALYDAEFEECGPAAAQSQPLVEPTADAKDAARYRWLRDHANDYERDGAMVILHEHDEDNKDRPHWVLCNAALDETIDSALAAPPQQHQVKKGELHG